VPAVALAHRIWLLREIEGIRRLARLEQPGCLLAEGVDVRSLRRDHRIRTSRYVMEQFEPGLETLW